jgi:hypothetical protein
MYFKKERINLVCVTVDWGELHVSMWCEFIVTAVINRSINMNLSVSISERQAEECFSVSVSWQQLLSQEAGLFLPDSIDNATVYGNWNYLIHFTSVTPEINDSGIVSVDGNDSFYTLPVATLIQGTCYKLWITVDMLLSNGTTLHLHSLQITTQIPTCSVGPGAYVGSFFV